MSGASEPTAEELAAILAAYEALWPKPVAAGDGPVGPGGSGGSGGSADTRWRFSGRWWSKPVALRRDRPTGR